MNRTILFTGLLTVVAMTSMGLYGVAHAQYLGNVGEGGETGALTLEEILDIQSRRITAVQENPASGSGTPYLSADGVLGASAIAGAVFGGIAAAFFFRSRSGKYAAMGRG